MRQTEIGGDVCSCFGPPGGHYAGRYEQGCVRTTLLIGILRSRREMEHQQRCKSSETSLRARMYRRELCVPRGTWSADNQLAGCPLPVPWVLRRVS